MWIGRPCSSCAHVSSSESESAWASESSSICQWLYAACVTIPSTQHSATVKRSHSRTRPPIETASEPYSSFIAWKALQNDESRYQHASVVSKPMTADVVMYSPCDDERPLVKRKLVVYVYEFLFVATHKGESGLV